LSDRFPERVSWRIRSATSLSIVSVVLMPASCVNAA
jgi:hypothetical protein